MVVLTMIGDASFGVRPWPNRRAVWMIVFLASILLALVGSSAVLLAYLAPQAPYESIGDLSDFPPGSAPYYVATDGGPDVFVVNTGVELIAFDALTPFDGLRVRLKWVPATGRFEDPYTGSKFTLMGGYIEGPAQRSLDRYDYRVLPDGTIQVDPWRVIPGEKHQ